MSLRARVGAGETRGGLPPRVVLVGFMAAGKSTVGPLLARRLGYRFVDLDLEVERLAGRPVPEIFRRRGEAGFRELEARATAALDDVRDIVVAVGGGWMARSELRDRWPDAVRVWLRVDPEAALDRLEGRIATRPMLDPSSPERSVRELLEERERAYGMAELTVETAGKSPRRLAAEIHRLLAERSGSSRARGVR